MAFAAAGAVFERLAGAALREIRLALAGLADSEDRSFWSN
jgi:hypothetical protein